MNVFVLGTGRCGTMTFTRACQHITNYTCSHESRAGLYTEARFEYPVNHIEADNRLSWFLGTLNKRFGQNAFYVHLIRDREAVVRSFQDRWDYHSSIMRAFGNGIILRDSRDLSEDTRRQIAEYYYDTVNENIAHFLVDKPLQQTLHLDTIANKFPDFWNAIDAKGDLAKALEELKTKYNQAPDDTRQASLRW